MRRLLVLLLLAAPAAALSQTAGQVLFAPDNIVNKAECVAAAATELDLTWKVTLETGTWIIADGQFKAYASATSPSGNYCNVGGTGVGLVGTVSSPPSDTQSTPFAIKVSDILAATAFDCSSGDKTIYVCVHWWSTTAGAAKGYAQGTVSLSVAAPSAPVIDKVEVGDTRLKVAIQPVAGTPAATQFRGRAVAHTPADDPGDHFSSRVASTATATIEGLINGIAYDVTAFAYSGDGNESLESCPYQATGSPPAACVGGTAVAPQTVMDAWELYRTDNGRDTGGCDTGPAGILALLGALALVRVRRRS